MVHCGTAVVYLICNSWHMIFGLTHFKGQTSLPGPRSCPHLKLVKYGNNEEKTARGKVGIRIMNTFTCKIRSESIVRQHFVFVRPRMIFLNNLIQFQLGRPQSLVAPNQQQNQDPFLFLPWCLHRIQKNNFFPSSHQKHSPARLKIAPTNLNELLLTRRMNLKF